MNITRGQIKRLAKKHLTDCRYGFVSLPLPLQSDNKLSKAYKLYRLLAVCKIYGL